MLCPSAKDPKYRDFKKLQEKNPGVDVFKAMADSEEKDTPVKDEIENVKVEQAALASEKAKKLKAAQAG